MKAHSRSSLFLALLFLMNASCGDAGDGSTTSGSGGQGTGGQGTGGTTPECPGDLESCESACVDTRVDPAHCGSCDTVCAAGQTCSEGICTTVCGGGTTKCGDLCVDTQSDEANCGGCAQACSAGEACSNGVCGLSCGGGTLLCGGACIDPDIDPTHCGDCVTACAPGEVCSNGVCELSCVGGSTRCGGACVDTNTDPAHCGDCLTACGLGEVCDGGSCALSCGGGTLDCNGSCVDPDLDPAHCGDCMTACAPGESCVNGSCALVCTGGATLCGNACVSLASDPSNCGACGTTCTSDETCIAGTCEPLCPGSTKCGSVCVDLQTSKANCGACGQPCAVGSSCSGGTCHLPTSCLDAHNQSPGAPDGVYTIDLDGAGPKAPFDVRCDMTVAGGGYTLALNLDTSDGNVMWWANPLWTNTATLGTAATALTQDHKSEAYNSLTGATEILVVVHQEGTRIGYKRFAKVNGATLLAHMQGGDNTIIGSAVLGSDIAALAPQERVVRLSTALYANHCISTGGSCTSGSSGSPDGDRLGSNEATPSDNTGGGLGNWHDMRYCCAGQSYAGKTCVGAAFRTTSEAQGGWGQCYTATTPGYFGTDTFGPGANTCSDATCGSSGWSSSNGLEYDFAVYLR